ncbi:MAG TPA: S8 family serine peptidase [Chloroflexia bacterium]|nr:S8 family serine peptidase [Chloroflexia bacterium]
MQIANIKRSQLMRNNQVPHVLVVAGKPQELDIFEKLSAEDKLFQEALGGSQLDRVDDKYLPVPAVFAHAGASGWQEAPLSYGNEPKPITAQELYKDFSAYRDTEQGTQARRYRLQAGLNAGEVEKSLRAACKFHRDQLDSIDIHLDGIFQTAQMVGGNSPTLREKPVALPDATDDVFNGQSCFGSGRLGLNYREDAGQGVTVFILDTSPEVNQVCYKTVDFWMDLCPERDFPEPLPYERKPEHLDDPHLRSLPKFKPAKHNRQNRPGELDGETMQPYHGLMIATLIRRLAPKATIVLARAMYDNGESAGTTLSYATDMIDYLKKNKVQANGRRVVEEKLVVNMSFGLFRTQAEEVNAPYMLTSCNRLCEEGAIIVSAAGNNSYASHPQNPQEPSAYGYFADTPATDTNLIAVAATSEANAYAWFSNQSNLAAPGYDLTLDVGEKTGGSPSRFVEWSGSSFASPLVAGTIAHLMSAPYNVAANEIKGLLWKTATWPASWNGVPEISLAKAINAVPSKPETAKPSTRKSKNGRVAASSAASV